MSIRCCCSIQTMRDDFSLFLLKNSFGSKMKKGFRNLCSGESSTSTLHQQRPREQPQTLEEMILQLEMEEKTSRRGKVEHRMSCVSSSDILRSARNAALNQYPRFSLDGKDAMYRCSFAEVKEKKARLPSVVGGESVIWCKPGVVGRLMGLEAMPIPLNSKYRRERVSAIIKAQNIRKRAEKACSRTGYCLLNPVRLEIPTVEAGWPRRRFL